MLNREDKVQNTGDWGLVSRWTIMLLMPRAGINSTPLSSSSYKPLCAQHVTRFCCRHVMAKPILPTWLWSF